MFSQVSSSPTDRLPHLQAVRARARPPTLLVARRPALAHNRAFTLPAPRPGARDGPSVRSALCHDHRRNAHLPREPMASACAVPRAIHVPAVKARARMGDERWEAV